MEENYIEKEKKLIQDLRKQNKRSRILNFILIIIILILFIFYIINFRIGKIEDRPIKEYEEDKGYYEESKYPEEPEELEKTGKLEGTEEPAQSNGQEELQNVRGR